MKSKLFNIFKVVVGSLIILGFLSTLGTMFFIEIPETNKMAIDIVLGTLGTLTVTIVTHLFGSSQSSEEKNETIREFSKQLANK